MTNTPDNNDRHEREWRDISTAPKDGQHIWAWNEEFGQRETYMKKYGKGSVGYEAWERGDGPLNCGWAWSEPKCGWLHSWKPTHWMPLPAPPKPHHFNQEGK